MFYLQEKNEINKIKEELSFFKKEFDKHLISFLNSLQPHTIIKYLLYYIKIGGKRIRPFIFYKYLKEEMNKNAFEDENLKKLMFCLEIYHNSLLILDDLEDKDLKRRNKDSLWVLIGKEQSINVAFYSINLIHKIIDSTSFPLEIKARITRNLAEITEKTLEGQILDLYLKKKIMDLKKLRYNEKIILENYKEIKEKIKNMYLKSIILKTAYYIMLPFLFAYSLKERQDKKELETIKKEFLIVGMFFQIMNDLEDIFGKNNDLKEGFISLPYLLLIEKNPEFLITFLNSDFLIVEELKKRKINKIIYKRLEKIKKRFLFSTVSLQIADLILDRIKNMS